MVKPLTACFVFRLTRNKLNLPNRVVLTSKGGHILKMMKQSPFVMRGNFTPLELFFHIFAKYTPPSSKQECFQLRKDRYFYPFYKKK